jgi:hypothetical protein
VLVLAMVAFPDMIAASVTQAQVAASWQQVGADAIIQVGHNETFLPTLQQQVAAVPGVVATAFADVETGSVSSGSSLSVVYVDPAQYAAVVDQTPGPRFPLAALSKSAATTLPAVGAAAAAQLLGTSPVDVSVGSSTVTIQLAGRISGVPGVPANPAIVVPDEPLGSNPGGNLMLVAGPRLDAARLSAVVHNSQPDASVTLRATALAALTTAPVLQAARTALTQGLATAAGFDLAAFSGTGSAIAVTPAAFPLVASAAGLVLAALLVLAVQAVITYYRGSARALRIAD